MRWYRDKKFVVGNIAVPAGAAIFTSLVAVGVAIVGWVYFAYPAPNSQTIISNTGIATQGQTGSNTINNISQQHHFSAEQHIIPFPDFLGGKKVLELDNVATLTISPFVYPTRDRAVFVLDFIATPPAMKCISATNDGCDKLHGSNIFRLVTGHGPIYSFDAQHVRQDIPVGGRTFVVALKGVNNVRLPELEKACPSTSEDETGSGYGSGGICDQGAFEFVFGISER